MEATSFPGVAPWGPPMQIHTPFHPLQNHPVNCQTVQIGNLLMILLGIALVLLVTSYAG